MRIKFSSLDARKKWMGVPRYRLSGFDIWNVVTSCAVILLLTIHVGPDLYSVLSALGLSPAWSLGVMSLCPPFIVPLIYFTGLGTAPFIRKAMQGFTCYYLTETSAEIEIRLYVVFIGYSLPLVEIKNIRVVEDDNRISVSFCKPIIHWWDFLARFKRGEPVAADAFEFVGLDKTSAHALLDLLKDAKVACGTR